MPVKPQRQSSVDGSIGLQKLLHEPERLEKEADQINNELEALVTDNYRVFVENLTCSLHLQSEEKTLEDISSNMKSNITSLQQMCSQFKDRVNLFLQFHKRNRKTLQYHLQLLELLEIPQLIEACFHNEFFDEAIELANFIYSLERRNLLTQEVKHQQVNSNTNDPSSSSTEISKSSTEDVIQNIVNEVETLLNRFSKLLITQCTESVSLPKQMTVFSTLRKLDHLFIDRKLILERTQHQQQKEADTEDTELTNTANIPPPPVIDENTTSADMLEYYAAPLVPMGKEEDAILLRHEFLLNAEVMHHMQYLEARTVWLTKQQQSSVGKASASTASTSNASSSNSSTNTVSYSKCLELLEHVRTGWYTIVTHYRALFLDSVSANKNNNKNSNSTSNSTDSSTNAPTQASFEDLKHDALQRTAFQILQIWTTKQVRVLLTQLQSYLKMFRQDGRSLKMLLEQVYYCSYRLASVGCEFFPLVVPMVEDILQEKIAEDLIKVKDKFVQMISEEKVSKVNPTTGNVTDQLVPLYHPQDFSSVSFTITSTATAASTTNHPSNPDQPTTINLGDISAPKGLLFYPPIAYLCNVYLATLSYLRDCQLTVFYGKGVDLLGQSFAALIQGVLDHATVLRQKSTKYAVYVNNNASSGSRNGSGNNNNNSNNNSNGLDLVKEYATAIAFDLIPHVFLCYQLIFYQLSPLTTQLHLTRFQQAQASYFHNPSNGGISSSAMPHFITEFYAPKMKDLFAVPYLKYLETHWKTLVQAGLLSSDCLDKAKPTIPPVRTHVITPPTTLIADTTTMTPTGTDAEKTVRPEEPSDEHSRNSVETSDHGDNNAVALPEKEEIKPSSEGLVKFETQQDTTTEEVGEETLEEMEVSHILPIGHRSFHLGNDISTELLQSPKQFYEQLRKELSKTKKTITFSALYLGTAEHEEELIQDIRSALSDKTRPDLQVTMIFDHSRAQRGPVSSLSLLLPLVKDFPDRFRVLLYQLPQLRGLWCYFLPLQLREVIGVYHCKFCVADNTVIITGANLSKEYFVSRQDRYWLMENKSKDDASMKINHYLQEFVRAVAPACHLLLPDGSLAEPRDAQHLKLKEFHMHKNIAAHPASPRSSLEKNSLSFVPLMQHQRLCLRDEESFFRQLFSALAPPASPSTSDQPVIIPTLHWSTPYTNFSSSLLQSMLQVFLTSSNSNPNPRPCIDLIGPDDSSHGFASATGVKALIPRLHETALSLSIEEALRAMQFQQTVSQDPFATSSSFINHYAFSKPGWTFHAKGFWLSLDTDNTSSRSDSLPQPVGTYIGSSNFGERSWQRDFELGFFFYSNAPQHRQFFAQDYALLRNQCTAHLPNIGLPLRPKGSASKPSIAQTVDNSFIRLLAWMVKSYL